MLKTFVSGIKMYLDKVVNQLRNEVGWKSESSEQLFSETVTTIASELSDEGYASLSYSDAITADTITVTFDGVEYICEKHAGMTDNIYVYGGVDDFTEYPFYIISEQRDENTVINEIHTATPGTYTVSATAESVTYTDAFKKGVTINSTFYVDFDYDDNDNLTVNRSVSEIKEAYASGANVIGRLKLGAEEYALYSLSYIEENLRFINMSASSGTGRMYITNINVYDDNGNTVVDRITAYFDGTLESGGSGGEDY